MRELSPAAILLFGIVMGYVFISMEFWSIVGPIVGIAIGGLIGLLAVGALKFGYLPEGSDSTPTALDARLGVIVTSLFVVAMVVLFRFHTYERPALMYVLVAGYAGWIGYFISRGGSKWQTVPQISTLAFFTYWSSQWVFPAGMYGPDTVGKYLPAINEVFETGSIPSSVTIYAGHIAHTAEFIEITGLDDQTGYFLLATLLLVATVPVIAIVDETFPAISSKTASFAALIFAMSSWTLGRGFHPNKLNYFYALILLLGLVAIHLYRKFDLPQSDPPRWLIIGLLIVPAIVFGHQFSAGASLIFIVAIAGFSIIALVFGPIDYDIRPSLTVVYFAALYVLAILGNPTHQGPLLDRLAGLIKSIIKAGEATGGAGRYSELALNVLIASTAAQTLLFILTVLGAIWMFRQREWEYDFVLFWTAILGAFLAVGLAINSADTQPQRFYSFLLLFGFNIYVGAFFVLVGKYGGGKQLPVSLGRIVVSGLIVVFVVTSLASPIADTTMSPVADDLPHYKKFHTHQLLSGNDWLDQYAPGAKRIIAPDSTIPIEQTGPSNGVANLSALNASERYAYSDLSDREGVTVYQGLNLGSRAFVFVPSPARPAHDRLYANGQTSAYQR